MVGNENENENGNENGDETETQFSLDFKPITVIM